MKENIDDVKKAQEAELKIALEVAEEVVASIQINAAKQEAEAFFDATLDGVAGLPAPQALTVLEIILIDLSVEDSEV